MTHRSLVAKLTDASVSPTAAVQAPQPRRARSLAALLILEELIPEVWASRTPTCKDTSRS
jgi:hypothetical protein